MNTYQIEVVETLIRVITVDANSAVEAKDLIQEQYEKGDIVLDSNDYQGYEINLL